MEDLKIITVEKFPRWQVNIIDKNSTVGIGDTIHKTLKPKEAPTLKEAMERLKHLSKQPEQKSERVTLRVNNQEPIKIWLRVKSSWFQRFFNSKKLGVPVVMVIQEDLNPSDPLKFGMGVLGLDKLPGFPIAFAIGSFKKPAVLKLKPERDGFLGIIFWLIRGPLNTLPEEINDPEMDYDEEYALGIDAEGLADLISLERITNSINSLSLTRAWEGEDYNKKLSSNKWEKRQVVLTIRKGPNDAPPPEDIIQNIVSKAKVNLTKNLTEEQKNWIKVYDRSESFIASLEKRFEIWQNIGFCQDIIDKFGTLKEKIISWTTHPNIQAPLLSLERHYRGWPAEEKTFSTFFIEIQGEKAYVEILELKASETLSKMLDSVGAIEGIIIDKRGVLIAAVKPGNVVNLSEDESWAVLESNTDKDILITEPHIFQNYDFLSRTMAISVKSRDGIFLGWIILELFVKNVE